MLKQTRPKTEVLPREVLHRLQGAELVTGVDRRTARVRVLLVRGPLQFETGLQQPSVRARPNLITAHHVHFKDRGPDRGQSDETAQHDRGTMRLFVEREPVLTAVVRGFCCFCLLIVVYSRTILELNVILFLSRDSFIVFSYFILCSTLSLSLSFHVFFFVFFMHVFLVSIYMLPNIFFSNKEQKLFKLVTIN